MKKQGVNIAAVILGDDPVRDACSAKKAGADMLELRLDQFRSISPEYLAKIIKEIKGRTHLPLIATLRYRGEEKFLPLLHRISEERRLEILSGVIPIVDLIDIELRAKISKRVISIAHRHGKRVIVSYHNFKKTPSFKQLACIAREAGKRRADIVKIAAFARSKEEVARLMAFAYLSKIKPIITISMGELGSISRIIAPLFGSDIVYAHANKKAAPGQLPISELKSLLLKI